MGNKEMNLLRLLMNGGRYTVLDICARLRIGDPRSVIRNLRRKGYAVVDEWETGVTGVHYKRYWVAPPGESGNVQVTTKEA